MGNEIWFKNMRASQGSFITLIRNYRNDSETLDVTVIRSYIITQLSRYLAVYVHRRHIDSSNCYHTRAWALFKACTALYKS